MTSSNFINAIDVALKFLELNKLCWAGEDENSFYFTGCGDNGDVIFGEATCRVDKRTLKYSNCYKDEKLALHISPIRFPNERKEVFSLIRDPYGNEYDPYEA